MAALAIAALTASRWQAPVVARNAKAWWRPVVAEGLQAFLFLALWFVVLGHTLKDAVGEAFLVAVVVSTLSGVRARTRARLARLDMDLAAAHARSAAD